MVSKRANASTAKTMKAAKAGKAAKAAKAAKAGKVGKAANAAKAAKATPPTRAGKAAKTPTARAESDRDEVRPLPFEALNDIAPGLMRSQNAWLSQIDSLSAPDRKTHELIRMVCSVVARNPRGIRHHAMLAGEVGASWEEVAGSIVLAEPAFGILVVVEAFPWARKGWERGSLLTDDEEES